MVASSTDAWLDTIPDSARNESKARLFRLSKSIVAEEICFLFGAGMSKASGLPLARDLAIMMVGELLNGKRPRKPWPNNLAKLADTYPAEAIAEAYVKVTDKPHLKAGLVAEELGQGSGEIHDGHHALEHLASQGYIDRVYTTNFDTLIEDAFDQRGFTIGDNNVDDIQRAENDLCP